MRPYVRIAERALADAKQRKLAQLKAEGVSADALRATRLL
jgi:hypothetical protein